MGSYRHVKHDGASESQPVVQVAQSEQNRSPLEKNLGSRNYD